ncbi:MAG: hypothetical protein A2725_04575 [Candidatus Magasanikbacteria bacterium RIFCSPHIGHO2_01_FULL_33_34]|uniref:Uncharacterized protein n=1 Tax=Candidatus Magasanikbacteria bacterium RIFCSPHIGHO2_01_FULL_33_34 TaxID=1798671 RepID=A0A1F6LLC6_9BACT|nr:MAG: hypothetical protein A2725_04575 [Candidatus Magasanikbacteria bacterium RIFCSPHIGHO2_01_FULL_33_34]OGH65926.1 MAG: hypothetical protein A3B83_02215 [Candidatus Magasanikbacteria bacterium RIFCSPHIGHO2_02_FULL_33_17]OGH75795.1 MAG: hypothetical protein A3A89_02655 [Candidatus Magasanikbacteria bacterium RIFCSPLOWO2_01_FULL_33_34]OGH81349.1 MAG: hypothetical protein A3F93_02195 [Candidatus Magasanikbacteria bacterium RIFCSPLOWO2_12_FULL_34_7]
MTTNDRANGIALATNLVQSILDAGGTYDDVRRLFANKQFHKEMIRWVMYDPCKCWKEILLGVELPSNSLVKVSYEAEQMVRRTPACAVVGKKVRLANVSPSELGFREDTVFSEVCELAFESGLRLCPAEVGPQLRYQYLDQRTGDKWLRIAMTPILMPNGHKGVFRVGESNGSLQLVGYYLRGEKEDIVDLHQRLIFLCPDNGEP